MKTPEWYKWLYWFSYRHPYWRIWKINEKYQLFLRNHWFGANNDPFIIVIRIAHQGPTFKTLQFGLFNFCLCLGISKD